VAKYPSALLDARIDREALEDFEVVQEFVGSVRTIRAEHDVPWSRSLAVHWHTDEKNKRRVLQEERMVVEALAGCVLHFESDATRLDDAQAQFDHPAVFVNSGVRAVVPEVIDPDRERERLQRDLKKLDKELGAVEKKLDNPSFLERAPAAVVEKSRRDASELRQRREQLKVALSRL